MALTGFFSASRRLLQQQREIDRLRKEVSTLRTQNDSMREGMRRCVSCEYRIDFKARQDQGRAAGQSPVPSDPDGEYAQDPHPN